MKNQKGFSLIELIIGIALMAVLCIWGASKAQGAGYSNGYRMGQLTKFSMKGHFVKSGEGQLSMGREGSFYERCNGSGKERTCKRINPWAFSADSKKAPHINALSGKYVVIKYSQVQLNNPLKYSTSYRVEEITPVDKSIDLAKGFIATLPTGSKSKGFRVGRIVKASIKGNFTKTYEIVMQVGNSGNQYKHMSTKYIEIYNLAIKALRSAKKIKVLYTERGLLQFSMDDTKYQVYGIETLEDI